MKKINIKFFALILGLAIGLSSCFQTEEIPLMVYDGKATHNIEDLFALHNLGTDATLITDSIVISGVVVSTDEFGSCYKEIYIQDSTGGISIKTANSAYFHKYRMGQRVFVNCKDLYLGGYIANNGSTGWYQLGLWGNGELQYLPTNYDQKHIFRSGIPEAVPTPKDITNASQITESDFHTLVRLVNCQFVDANGVNTYYDPSQGYSATSRNLKLQSGSKEVIVRTSQYADFALNILPDGKINVTGILTKYGGDYQLVIRDIKDVASETICQYNMNINPFDNGWTTVCKSGSNWNYNSQYKIISITGNASEQTDAWFISPTLNFSHLDNVNILLTSQNFNSLATQENLKLHISTDNGITWTEISIPTISGDMATISVELPELATTTQQLKVAFQYYDNQPSTWSIQDITFKTTL